MFSMTIGYLFSNYDYTFIAETVNVLNAYTNKTRTSYIIKRACVSYIIPRRFSS